MKPMKYSIPLLIILSFLFFVGCSDPKSEVKDQTATVDSLFRSYYEFKLRITL
ncbi:MAG TPA: hypothetical protein VIS49_12640 [Cyclobacteriaceae bacterium]